MAEIDNAVLAQEVFDRLSAFLTNEAKWKFNVHEHEGQLIITTMAQGNDLPLRFCFTVDPRTELLTIISNMTFQMPQEKLLDGAVAVSMINQMLAYGCFDYDVKTGDIAFRMSTCFKGGLASDEVFGYMLSIAAFCADRYNDKLLLISMGALSLEDFYNFIHSDK